MRSLLIRISPLVLLLVLLNGCKDDKPSSKFSLNFAAKYGTENFNLNSSYVNSDGRTMKFEKMKFFVSRITLIKNDNSEVELKDVAIVDFSKPSTLQISTELDDADFKAIRIGLGVDSIQNLSTPQTAPSNSALNSSQAGEMYWSWLKYTHQFIEGKFAEVGSTNFYGAIVYHIGSNALYRTITFTKDMSVCCEKETQHTVTLDVKKIFDGPPAIDLATEGVTESQESKYAIAEKFVGNFEQSFSFE